MKLEEAEHMQPQDDPGPARWIIFAWLTCIIAVSIVGLTVGGK